MSDSTLSITLSNPSTDEGDYVLIEQKAWNKEVGRTSKTQGILAIGSTIFGGLLPDPNCGGLEGFDTPVYCYPSRSTLAFTFGISHGQFAAGCVEVLQRKEMLNCSLQDSAELDYPVHMFTKYEWVGECFDELGNVVISPSVRRSGRTFFFDRKVYGTLHVTYAVYRRYYAVRIEEREDSLENSFQSAAYAVWTGGVRIKEISAPSGYDETKGNCGNGLYGQSGGGSTEVCSPKGKGTYPKAVRADRHIKIDYCSQELMSDEITEIVDNETDGGECD